MKTKKTLTIVAKAAAATKPAKSPKSDAAVPAKAVAKMTAWNEAHPELKFSWIVIGPDTPTAHQACKTCKKKFKDGRITRVSSDGAFCGPKCQRPRKAKAKAAESKKA